MKSPFSEVELEVVVHGRPVQEYVHRKGKVLIEGRKGSEYSLRIRNNADRRVTVVLSVDGLSVMNGKPATKNDRGYILAPYSARDIPGWRLDDKDVASFIFGELPNAYAAQMGKPTNIGVIGAVFYYEHEPESGLPLDMIDMYSGGDMKGGGVGTGYGRRQSHRVTSTFFVREDSPLATLLLYYDDADGLTRREIYIRDPHKEHDRVMEANAFPNEGCPPPANWRG